MSPRYQQPSTKETWKNMSRPMVKSEMARERSRRLVEVWSSLKNKTRWSCLSSRLLRSVHTPRETPNRWLPKVWDGDNDQQVKRYSEHRDESQQDVNDGEHWAREYGLPAGGVEELRKAEISSLHHQREEELLQRSSPNSVFYRWPNSSNDPCFLETQIPSHLCH